MKRNLIRISHKGQRKINYCLSIGIFYIFLFSILCCVKTYATEHSNDQTRNYISGIIFHDKTGNEQYESEKDVPLEGVAVSNGREIEVTDQEGRYELPLRDNSIIFVIKPQNWMVPIDENQLPRFYHIHSSDGLSGTEFDGLPPTGEIPESVNFPLYPVDEPDEYEVLVFGDTQTRNEEEVYYIAHDVLTELVGNDSEFGVTLGDVVFDDLDLYPHFNHSIATVGIPWRNLLGNHDIDFTGDNNEEARGTFYRTFGPTYYSFSHGPAHYIILDNIRWIVEDDSRYYRTGLGEDQMEFLRNELSRIGPDKLVVLMAHIPWHGPGGGFYWKDESERDTLYKILSRHPNSVSLVSHHHKHYHRFLDEEEGFPGEQPHHMISVGSVCGAWYTGVPDEYGIPHAMMSDGTPTSYTFLHIDKNDWKLRWKAARRPADFQMHIHTPDAISLDNLSGVNVTANIFNALPTANVEMRIGDSGPWTDMKRVRKDDPVRVAALDWEKQLDTIPWRPLSGLRHFGHVWEAKLNDDLKPGVHVIHVRATDEWWTYEGKRIFRVRE